MVNQGRASEIEAEALLSSAQEILETDVMLIPDWFYRHLEAEALDRIPRDPDDWPTVALALALGAAIWTQDYDFFGCGCPVWTTETLLIQMRRRSGG